MVLAREMALESMMGNIIAKLKSLDYKQAALDHAEKAVLGLVIFFVLISLMKTSWIPYSRQPEEFTSKVDQQTQALQASTMPQENIDKLKEPRSVDELVNELMADVDISQYEYMTPNFFELYPRKEKRRDPVWLTIQDLETTPGRAILAVAPSRLFAEGNGSDEPKEEAIEPATTKPNPLAPRNARNPLAPRGGNPNNAPGAIPPAGAPMPEQVASGPSGMGFHFVSVRGVFPYKEQLEKLAQALHVGSPADAAELFDLVEFKVQRQSAVAGPDPWAGEWEDVDMDFVYRLLQVVDDFDAEVVPTSGTDSVITMPLPMRVAGYWGNESSHSQIASLNEKQQEAQRLYQNKMLAEKEKQQAAAEKTGPVKKGGFNPLIEDVRTIQNDIFNTPQGQALREKLREEVQKETGIDPASVAVAGRILLFRFFDFTVEPGNAYRYQVQLEVRNPNYNVPIEELVDPAYARDQTISTAWSNPSQPSVVENDVNFFVTKVDSRRDLATMNVFQWYDSAGTTVIAELEKLSVGAQIAENVDIEVLRPAAPSWQKEGVPISTGHALVDVRGNPRITSIEYPNLVKDLKIESPRGVVLPSQVLTVDEHGDLLGLDTKTSSVQNERMTQNITSNQDIYSHLKGEKPELTALERLAAEGDGATPPEETNRRPGNPARRRTP